MNKDLIKKVILKTDGKINIIKAINFSKVNKNNIIKSWNHTDKDGYNLWDIYLELRYDNIIKFKNEDNKENYNDSVQNLFIKSRKLKRKEINKFKRAMGSY